MTVTPAVEQYVFESTRRALNVEYPGIELVRGSIFLPPGPYLVEFPSDDLWEHGEWVPSWERDWITGSEAIQRCGGIAEASELMRDGNCQAIRLMAWYDGAGQVVWATRQPLGTPPG